MEIPPAFSALVGQEQAIQLLLQAVRQQRVAPAYGFMGTPGIGRRLAARCFAKYLFAEEAGVTGEMRDRLNQRLDRSNHPDLLWVEPTYLHQGKRFTAQEAEAADLKRKTPPQIRLEQIRDVARFVARQPLEARRSLVIIEQAETMAEAAANALLKTLEEPGNATLILCAPGPDAILPTLVSRCQRIPFVPLQPEDLARVLQAAGHGEILQNQALIDLAQGSPGEAIALWQTLQAIPEEILVAVRSLPQTPKQALSLASQITKTLSSPQQLWLLSYLQRQFWVPSRPETRHPVQRLEEAKTHLLRYVQPLLTWEVLLLNLAGLMR